MEHEQGTWFNFLRLIKIGPLQIGPWHIPQFPLLPAWAPPAMPLATLAAVLLVVLAYFGMRHRRRLPVGLQNVLEMLVEWLDYLSKNLLGEQGRQFLPFLGTFFIYILTMNLMGLIPGFLSPTSNLNVTLGLALIVFVAVQYYGVKANGVWGYIKHFTGDIWWLVPLILPIHVIGELVRPISLAVRLFGNVMGGETVVMVLAGISPILFARQFHGLVIGLPIPVALPMVLLEIFTSTVQALVFTLLAAAYLAGVMEHQEAAA